MTEKVIPGQTIGVDLEALFDSLRHICDTLESGGVSMEESVQLYAQGEALRQAIKQELARPERRVVEIIDENGITPFEWQKDGASVRGGTR